MPFNLNPTGTPPSDTPQCFGVPINLSVILGVCEIGDYDYLWSTPVWGLSNDSTSVTPIFTGGEIGDYVFTKMFNNQ